MAQPLVTFAVLLVLFQVGWSLKCYQCISDKEAKCADLFNENHIQSIDCTYPDTVTYQRLYLYNRLPADIFSGVVGAPKACYKINLESGTIIRSCLEYNPTNINLACDMLSTLTSGLAPEKKVVSCKACDKDNCNGPTIIL